MRCSSPPVSIKHSLCRHSWSCLTFSHSLELLLMDIFGGFLGLEAFDSSEVPDGKAQLLPPWGHTPIMFTNGGFCCHWPARFHTLFMCLSVPHVLNLFAFPFSMFLLSSLTRTLPCYLKDGSFSLPFSRGGKSSFLTVAEYPHIHSILSELLLGWAQSQLPAACDARSLCIAVGVPDLDSCLIPALPLCQHRGTCPALQGWCSVTSWDGVKQRQGLGQLSVT